MSISNEPKINEVLEKCRSKNAWGMLLSKELDDEGIEQDILKNHRSLTIYNILACSNTYVGNGTSEAPPDNKTLLDFTPGTNENHKRILCKRVRSQMTSQHVFGRLD